MDSMMQLIDKYAELGAYACDFARRLKDIENGNFPLSSGDLPFVGEDQTDEEIRRINSEYETKQRESIIEKKTSIEQMQVSVLSKIDDFIVTATKEEKETIIFQTSTKVGKMYDRLNHLETVILVSKLLGDIAFDCKDSAKENEENKLHDSYLVEKDNIRSQMPFYTRIISKLESNIKTKKI